MKLPCLSRTLRSRCAALAAQMWAVVDFECDGEDRMLRWLEAHVGHLENVTIRSVVRGRKMLSETYCYSWVVQERCYSDSLACKGLATLQTLEVMSCPA